MKKHFSGAGYLFIYLLVILVFNIVILNLPLSGVFGYEFAVLNSFVLAILSGIYTLKLNKNIPWPVNFIRNLFYAFTAFLAVPLSPGLLQSIFGLTCSLSDGLLFFLVLTVPSVLIGSSLGLAASVISRKFPLILFITLVVIIISIPIFEIYFYPQIYFYNPFIGFFPGTIYDEGMSVTIKLVIYRLLNIAFFGFLFLILTSSKAFFTKLNKKALVAVAFSAALVFILLSPYFGFSTSEKRLTSELSRRIETEHFIIYFPSNADSRLVKAGVLHHEYYYSELTKFFKLNLNQKITSFVFSSSYQKGKLFGAENADVAKPWLRQVYTTVNNYNSTLKHELAHIFSAEFSSGIFKVASGFSPAFIEGIATAVNPVYDDYRIDYLAAAAYKNNYKVSIQRLFGITEFFGSVSSLSYVYVR